LYSSKLIALYILWGWTCVWIWQPVMEVHCVARNSEEHGTCIIRLVPYGPLCGQATSVQATEMREAWQDMRNSAVTGRDCICKTNLSVTTTLPVFILGTDVALVNILIKTVCNSCGPATRKCPSHWRITSLLGPSDGLPTT
jgi:hypothetical protein